MAVGLLGLAGATAVEGAVYTVVNTKNAGTGSLRTAIQNANAVPGSTIGFAIPTTDPNYDPATGVFTIRTTTPALPAITAAGTILDGTTQATAIGDTNPGFLGTGGTVGAGGIPLPVVERPEILLQQRGFNTVGIDVQAPNVVIRGLAIYGFGSTPDRDSSADIRVGATASGVLIERNVIGSSPTAWADPGVDDRSPADHVRAIGGDGGILRDNLIGFGEGRGLTLNLASDGWLVEGNEFRRNGIGTPGLDGIAVVNGSGGAVVRGNLVIESEGCGVDGLLSAGGNTIVANTIQGNGVGTGAGLETPGVRLDGAGNVVDRNVIAANVGAGVLVAASASGNTITRNSVYANGASSGQIGIDLLSSADDPSLGTAPFVTPNDPGDADIGGNGLLNFPVLVWATLDSGQLTLAGFARPGSSIEVFLAAPDPSGFGEGQTYLFTAVEGSSGDEDATTGSYASPVNGLDQGSDTTNRFRFVVSAPPGVAVGTVLTATATVGTATSEFSGNVAVAASPLLTLVKSVDPPGDQPPGTDLAYQVVFANTGGADAYAVSLQDGVPPNSDLRVGSEFFAPGSTGLTAVTEFSSDGGSSWTYVPASEAGGAPPGYDRLATDIRWVLSGTLVSVPPANQGTVGFAVRIR